VGLGVGPLLAAPIGDPESPEAARAEDRKDVGREQGPASRASRTVCIGNGVRLRREIRAVKRSSVP
jgi:hypothetical protein